MQGEPFIREARTHPFNGTQEQRGVYTMTQEDSVRRLAEIRDGLKRGDNCFPLADVAFLMESIDSLTHLFHNKEHYEELVKGARLVRDEQQAEYECGFCTGGNDSHDDECVIPPFLAALAHIEESI